MSLATFLSPRVSGLGVDQVFRLDGTEGHHAAAVRRIRVGEQVFVGDGEGFGVRAETVSVGKNELELRVLEVLREPEHAHRWVAVQALPKGDRADVVVDSLTELGVDEICAWQADRSVVRWDGMPGKAEKGVAKWSTRAREAAKQSRRLSIPQVNFLSTAQVAERLKAADLAVICHESATASIATLSIPPSGEIVFVIGPEGGLTDAELSCFVEAGGTPVLIAEHVLRTSTAPVVALAQLQVLADV
jgi:16S rRNA (uracil1498-N3)-methyltransferase